MTTAGIAAIDTVHVHARAHVRGPGPDPVTAPSVLGPQSILIKGRSESRRSMPFLVARAPTRSTSTSSKICTISTPHTLNHSSRKSLTNSLSPSSAHLHPPVITALMSRHGCLDLHLVRPFHTWLPSPYPSRRSGLLNLLNISWRSRLQASHLVKC